MPVGDTWRLAEIAVEPGDRVELLPIRQGDEGMRLRPLGMLAGLSGAQIQTSLADHVDVDPAGDLLIVPCVPNGDWTWWLECAGTGRFKLLAEPASSTASLDGIQFDHDALSRLLSDPDRCDLEGFGLSLVARRLASQPGFEQLISLALVRDFAPLEHQSRTVKTLLRRMHGKAMLCDEVGLGKTVEAGLALLELVSRGLVRSVLVPVPPSLIEQWKGEMLRKFGLELAGQDDVPASSRDRTGWCDAQRVIASIHTAKREPYRSALLERNWDMIIVDEAHHLRNRGTQAWKFAAGLRKQFMLLLTATPVQNNLEELFNLVTLLEPGLLSTQKSFSRRFIDRKDQLTPRNVDDLHRLLGEVMVRNRRSTVGVQFTNRYARTIAVTFTPPERELYERLTAGIRGMLGREGSPLNRMALITLQMALGSSAAAASSMIENLLDRHELPPDLHGDWLDLHERASAVSEHAKLARLDQLLNEFGDKMVVFTQFRATQDLVADHLRRAGQNVVLFHGGLSRLAKEAAIEQFRGDARILVSTESGSEGRNLQFCNGLCNYDLPWNPMRIEQHVGRLSRIGQTRDVHVFNLVAAGTIEQAVLHLLEAKLNMFELVIGEIDMILGNLDEEKEFADIIADMWAESSGHDEFAARMELLGNRLLAAKLTYFRQKTQDEKLFGNRFAPEA